MRRADREIKGLENIVEVLDRCDTIRIALFDEEYPYIVPVSFGYEVIGGEVVLYIHGAGEGKKQELIAKNNKVCVEADIMNGYKGTGNSITADYQSVIGFGEIQKADHEEAIRGLDLLMRHCKAKGYSAEKCVALGITAVHKITLHRISGKKRF